MKTKRPTTNENAAAYASAKNDIAGLIDVLQQELAKHNERAKHNPRNGGLTGDLLKVRDDLLWTTAFISRMDRTDIEAFLADAN